jgi:arylsulfatase A-like enzyme
VFDAEGELSFDKRDNFVHVKPPTQEEFDRIWPTYKEQIRYADHFLGEVIAALDRQGLYDRATLIVTSDHGLRLSYPKGDQAIEVPSLTPEVPMFIRSPRVQPRKSDIDYQHADFGLTLMDILGIENPGLLAPRDDLPRLPTPVSALSENRPLRDKVFYAESEAMYWRYVLDEVLGTWMKVEAINHPIGDRTSLTGGK